MTQKIHYPERLIEWFTSCLLFVYGASLLVPGQELLVHGYEVFNQIGLTEPTFAAFFVLVSSVRMLALYINGHWPATPYIRLFCTMLSASIFLVSGLFFAVVYFNETPALIAASTYCVCAVFDIKTTRLIRSDINAVKVASRFAG